MKGISVYNVRPKEKRFTINSTILNYFITPSRLGFSWFLILFFIVFFLETAGYIISGNESFHFDAIDLSISIAGFILGFLTKLFDNRNILNNN